MDSTERKIQQLREKALVCQDCQLAQTRTNVVFGEGNPRARLVIIGQGPGENEDETGRPFVGRAGRLLDEVLNENQMLREDVWITNVLKCRPLVISDDGRIQNRPPLAGEIKACGKWLGTELTIISPTVVLCLGAPAANVIIHKNFKMTQERGHWFTDSIHAPFVMAAFHPAYILRLKGRPYEEAHLSLVNDIAEAKKKSVEAKDQPRLTLF